MKNLPNTGNLMHSAILVLAGACLLGPRPAAAADEVSVHMANPSPASMPYLIADDLGFYRDDNIDFNGRIMKVGVGVMATVAGDIDVTQILGLSLRGAIDKGADLKIVMLFNTLPMYSLFVANDVKGYQDLKGKKIASSSTAASASRVLRVALRDNGLDPKTDVTVFHMGGTPTRYQALLGGSVAASVLVPPFDVFARDKGYKDLLFANQPGVLMGGVSASTKFLENRPDVARRFLHATWKGLRYFKTEREGSIDVMVKWMKIKEDLAGKIYDTWIEKFSEQGYEPESFVNQVLEFEFGKTSEEMRNKAFDFSIVRRFSSK